MKHTDYCAFISYRHQSPDQEIAKALHTAIETYGIPASIRKRTGKKRMGKVFRDQEELPLSANLGEDIEAALEHSDWLIVICSPRYPESRWCMREAAYFMEKKGRDRVLTVLVDGEPEESFPDLIRYATGETGERIETEPLAADLRAENLKRRLKKLRREKLRLFAPMLGLAYDDLKRRARQRRIRIAAAAAAAAVLIGAGLAVFFTINHIRTESLRREAQLKQQLAEQEHRAAVENNIDALLEQAHRENTEAERRGAAEHLLEALQLSEQNEDVKRADVMTELRRTVYTEPYDPVFCFERRDVRLSDLQPSPDGKTAIGVCNRASIALIDFTANEIRYTVPCGDSTVTGLCFSQDGERFAAICDTGRSVRVFNSADGAEAFVYRSKVGMNGIKNLLFWKDADTVLLQDGDEFRLVGADGTEQVFYTLGEQQSGYAYDYNIYTEYGKATVAEMIAKTDEKAVMKICASPDRTRVLITGHDGKTGTIVLDDSGKRVSLLEGMPGTPYEKYALSQDGRYAACVSEFGFFAIWETDGGACTAFLEADRCSRANLSAPAFSPDADEAAVIIDGNLWVLSVRTEEKTEAIGIDRAMGYVPSVCYSADGRYLLAVKEHLYFIDARQDRILFERKGAMYQSFVGVAAFPHGIFAAQDNGAVSFYCLPEHAAAQTGVYSGELAPAYDAAVWSGAHASEIEGVYGALIGDTTPDRRYDREGRYAALLYRDGTIELFDAQSDRLVDTVMQLNGEIRAFAMANDRLIATSEAGGVLFYDLKDRQVIGTVSNAFVYRSVAIDPNVRFALLVRAGDKEVAVYDAAHAELLFSVHTEDAVEMAAFSADGRYAVLRTDNGDVTVDLYAREADLIAAARRLAGLYQ